MKIRFEFFKKGDRLYCKFEPFGIIVPVESKEHKRYKLAKVLYLKGVPMRILSQISNIDWFKLQGAKENDSFEFEITFLKMLQ